MLQIPEKYKNWIRPDDELQARFAAWPKCNVPPESYVVLLMYGVTMRRTTRRQYCEQSRYYHACAGLVSRGILTNIYSFVIDPLRGLDETEQRIWRDTFDAIPEDSRRPPPLASLQYYGYDAQFVQSAVRDLFFRHSCLVPENHLVTFNGRDVPQYRFGATVRVYDAGLSEKLAGLCAIHPDIAKRQLDNFTPGNFQSFQMVAGTPAPGVRWSLSRCASAYGLVQAYVTLAHAGHLPRCSPDGDFPQKRLIQVHLLTQAQRAVLGLPAGDYELAADLAKREPRNG